MTELNGGEEVDGESLKIVNNHVTFCIRARHWWSYPKHWLVDEAFNIGTHIFLPVTELNGEEVVGKSLK